MKLTRRELFLLIFLAIIALIFFEYRFVVTPGLARFKALATEEANMQAQIDAINLNLKTAASLRTKRDENLTAIAQQAAPFFDTLAVDALLASTHRLLLQNQFQMADYVINEAAITALDSTGQPTAELSYALKDLAADYQVTLTGQLPGQAQPAAKPATGQKAGTAAGEDQTTANQLESVTFIVKGSGTYAQIKHLLADLSALERTIVVSQLIVETDEKSDSLIMNLTLTYYGIPKLTSQDDPYNQWQRSAFDGGLADPFKGLPR